jgi:Tol biopolymer transport system component
VAGKHAFVTDFGVAKALSTATSPRTLTGTGFTVGTPAYMAPEQIAADPAVDHRADIYALGALAYEALTGSLPFGSEEGYAALAAQFSSRVVPVTTLRTEVPPALAAIVMRCLQRNPADRPRDVEEVLHALETVAAAISADPPRPVLVWVRRRSRLLWIGGAAAAVAGLLLVAASLNRKLDGASATELTQLIRLTSEPGLEDEPSWAPDGRSFAYVSDEDGYLSIWVRPVGGGRATRISQPGVDEAQPAWSPDGKRIAFVSTRNRGGRFGIFLGSRPIEFYVYGQNGDLYVMAAQGGDQPVKVADNAYSPSWSPDSRRLAFRSINDGKWLIYIVDADSANPAVVRGVAPRVIGLSWSPDGKWIAYVAGASAGTGWDLYVIPVDGGTAVQLTHDSTSIALSPTWARDSRSIVYASNRGGSLNLWRVQFEPNKPGAAAEPSRLTTGVSEDVNPMASPDGASLAYASVHTAPDVWEFRLGAREPVRLTSETTIEDYPRISPDGSQLLFYSDKSGEEELWLLNLETKQSRQLSKGGGWQNAWSPDGRAVAFGSPQGLHIMDISSGRVRTFARGLSVAYPAFSRDGTQICFQGRDRTGYRLYRTPVDAEKLSVVPTPSGEPGNPSWAPDGKSIFFQLDQLGYRNIWKVDVAAGAARQLSTGNTDDAHPDISPDGMSLLFLRNHRDIYVLPIAGGSPQRVHSAEKHNQLIEFPAWRPDGQSIVYSLAQKSGDIFALEPPRSR